MNKKIPVIIGICVLAVILIFFVSAKKTSNNLGQNLQNTSEKQVNVGENVCAEFPKSWVESVLGKTIVKAEPFNLSNLSNCQYFVDDNNAAFIKVENLSVDNQKTGQQALGRTVKTDPRIQMEHFIAVQENGLINTIYLVLNPSRYVAIDRTSTKVFDNEGEIAFAVAVSKKIMGGQVTVVTQAPPTQAKSKSETVPLPQEEDVVRNFFNLINEGKVSDAVSMLLPSTISDESKKQAWGVQLNAFKKVTVKKIEPAGENTFKVTLDVEMKPDTVNAQPIPYYGWGNGEFVRWVALEKVNNIWKVVGIATGP